jgi:ubiquinone/menaquinone biosynthesis C-methylase UbiE
MVVGSSPTGGTERRLIKALLGRSAITQPHSAGEHHKRAARSGRLAVIYVSMMANGLETRSYGRVFDAIADEYDRHRPSYPDALVDRACEVAGLAPGDQVLEIGCGTGQLTRSLLARGLQVTAVEPGAHLLARARDRLAGHGEVRFINARFEEASLQRAQYRAVFSATAIHWVDPDVGWRKIADALVEGGTVALLSFFGLDDPHSREDQRALRTAQARIAPELAREWPSYRRLRDVRAGAEDRSKNVSETWAWLGDYDVGRSYVSELFESADLVATPITVERNADALNALLGTMSFWARLSGQQRDQLAAENHALQQRLGRPIRSSICACLVTARRVPTPSR